VFYRWDNADLILNIRVQPRASKTALAEVMGEEIKLRITSAPVDGAANQQLVAYLAKTFGVAKSAVNIIAGEKARNKRVRIVRPEQLPAAILAAQHEYNESN
jgi:uncharacterized protein (TIGR00251 family)